MEYLAAHWLDIFTTILGLIYILLEYRASIALWLVGVIMPAMDRRLYLPTFIFFFLAWGATYYVLITFTDSTVPLLDAFTNALCFVGLWALARKYIEQWFFWIIVDIICCYLYVVKGIPFKAALYGLYVIIAVAGYWKWKKMMVK